MLRAPRIRRWVAQWWEKMQSYRAESFARWPQQRDW
jgi:hypothetical protein